MAGIGNGTAEVLALKLVMNWFSSSYKCPKLIYGFVGKPHSGTEPKASSVSSMSRSNNKQSKYLYDIVLVRAD